MVNGAAGGTYSVWVWGAIVVIFAGLFLTHSRQSPTKRRQVPTASDLAL